MPTNSDNFDLENWKITLPVDSKGRTSGTAKEVKNLIGYEDSRFFYDAKDGAMVFKAGVDGATTSGSKYARTELREMEGSDRADWKLSEGGTLTATLRWTKRRSRMVEPREGWLSGRFTARTMSWSACTTKAGRSTS